MPEVVLQNVINTVQVQNETGENSKELPIGALASNIAFGGLQSTVSVEDKLKDHKVNTRPIKGTRKRGETPEEDQKMREDYDV